MFLTFVACSNTSPQPEASTQNTDASIKNTEESNPQQEEDLPTIEDQKYSEEDIQRYNESVISLNRYLSGEEMYIQDIHLGTTLRQNDAMAYIYETFLNMPDYGRSEVYLSHFSVIPDVIIGESWVTTDNTGIHGHQDTKQYSNYEYNSQGQLIYYHDYQLASEYCRFLNSATYEYLYEYNNAGKLSLVGVFSGNVMEALITLSYDENGQLENEELQNARVQSLVYKINYTYNSLGKVTCRAETSGTGDFATYSETNYIYDENGLLIQKIYEDHKNLGWAVDRITTNYSYDTAGQLTQKNVCEQTGYSMGSFSYTKTDTYNYVYDQKGHIRQEVLTYGKTIDHNGEEREPSDLSREISYIYDDYYLYAEDNVVAEQVTEEAVNNSDNHDEYRDSEETKPLPVAFFALTDVKAFSIFKIDLDKDGRYIVGENLYSQDILSRDRPLVFWTGLHSTVPKRGVMFVDTLGVTRYYAISQSGEDGSVILSEFLITAQ